MGAIEAAQNLLVSFAEKAADDGKLDTIPVPRVSGVPSRSCADRSGPWKGRCGRARGAHPDLRAHAIVVLSRSMDEISERVAKMVAGTKDGKADLRRFADLWRITGIPGDAVKPAKTETVNGSPVYVHGGPFANVSIGIPTLVSVEMACALHDVVIVEAGYGADAGAQKWLDIACRIWRSGRPRDRRDPRFHVARRSGSGMALPVPRAAFEGLDILPSRLSTCGMARTIRFRRCSRPPGTEFREPIIGNLYRDGGDKLAPQLDAFVDAVTNGSMPAEPAQPQGHGSGGERALGCRNAYGVPADRVILKDGFAESLRAAEGLCASAGIDFGSLALVAVKSPATMTDNDRAPEAEERTVTLKKVEVHSGAGLVHVNLTTS